MSATHSAIAGASVRRTSLLAGAVMLAGLALASAAAAAPPQTTITFENDPVGAVPNGFRSADSPQVSFSDSQGQDLALDNFFEQSHGIGLAANFDDSSALIMDLRRPARSISLAFGNDDPGFTEAGDEAVLTLYLKGRQVGQESVVMNRDDIMNQRISYSGHPFDRAVFFYDATNPAGGLIEVVDDIRVGL